MWDVRKRSTAKSLHPERTRRPASAPPLPGILPVSIRRASRLSAGALTLGGLLHALPAQAVEFGQGEFRGSFDSTLSHGLTFRVGKRDDALAAGANDNDGNLNYDRGLVSNTSKFTSELDLDYRNFGAFARVTGFLDFENENGRRERTPLSDEAKDQVGKDIDLLDAYVTGAFEAGDTPVDMRLGSHVLNWGESTFIQNGINAINPFDVSRLRTPGSELREALVPVSMFSASVAPTDTVSIEGFYQLDWEETEIDPVGSYFSVTDYVGPGATRAVIPLPGSSVTDRGFGFGPLTTDINTDLEDFQVNIPGVGLIAMPQPLQADHDADFLNVKRTSDRDPGDSGQWGVALRYLAEELNATEFGFYFTNYHSRLPFVSANTGSRLGVQAGSTAASAVTSNNSNTLQTITLAVNAEVTAGLLPPGEVADAISTRLRNVAKLLAIDRYAKTGRYFIEYPEDNKLFGLSFNTQLGASGWALQGEYSFRPDAPLQRAEDALFADGLAPILRVLDSERPDYIDPADVPGYLATYEPSIVQGYVERDVSQAQATATKVLGPTLGADSMAFVTEVAVMHVHGMPDKNAAPLESPAGGRLATADAYADATSWGYRLAARLDYNNAIGAANLFPYLQFGRDVSGNSPAPIGSFVEGRTALTLGLRADYLNRWEAGIGFTRYAGKGSERSDRDFVSASVKYSF